MNPQFDKPNNLNLPPPMPEVLPMPPDAPAPEQAAAARPEMAPSAPERQPQPALTPAAAAVPAPEPPQQRPPTTDDVNATTSIATPVIADDNDLIEKEWVTKAKEIVERTRSDPYRQSKDMTVFRADYMQKRYNKTIKLPE